MLYHEKWSLSPLTNTSQTDIKRKIPKWMIATLSSAIIIALLAVYAFLTAPGILKPDEVIITGTISASGIALDKITFTNTKCGTKNVANISSTGDNSGIYSISLDNGYSYNVSITWNNSETLLNQKEMGELFLDTFEKTIVKDWSVQP